MTDRVCTYNPPKENLDLCIMEHIKTLINDTSKPNCEESTKASNCFSSTPNSWLSKNVRKPLSFPIIPKNIVSPIARNPLKLAMASPRVRLVENQCSSSVQSSHQLANCAMFSDSYNRPLRNDITPIPVDRYQYPEIPGTDPVGLNINSVLTQNDAQGHCSENIRRLNLDPRLYAAQQTVPNAYSHNYSRNWQGVENQNNSNNVDYNGSFYNTYNNANSSNFGFNSVPANSFQNGNQNFYDVQHQQYPNMNQQIMPSQPFTQNWPPIFSTNQSYHNLQGNQSNLSANMLNNTSNTVWRHGDQNMYQGVRTPQPMSNITHNNNNKIPSNNVPQIKNGNGLYCRRPKSQHLPNNKQTLNQITSVPPPPLPTNMNTNETNIQNTKRQDTPSKFDKSYRTGEYTEICLSKRTKENTKEPVKKCDFRIPKLKVTRVVSPLSNTGSFRGHRKDAVVKYQVSSEAIPDETSSSHSEDLENSIEHCENSKGITEATASSNRNSNQAESKFDKSEKHRQNLIHENERECVQINQWLEDYLPQFVKSLDLHSAKVVRSCEKVVPKEKELLHNLSPRVLIPKIKIKDFQIVKSKTLNRRCNHTWKNGYDKPCKCKYSSKSIKLSETESCSNSPAQQSSSPQRPSTPISPKSAFVKNSNVELYFGNKTVVECLICGYKNKNSRINWARHYGSIHPLSECLVSRFAPVIADQIRQGEFRNGVKYRSDNHVGLIHEFECYFCNKTLQFTAKKWIHHIQCHTTEYAYICLKCNWSDNLSKICEKCGKYMQVKPEQKDFDGPNLTAFMCSVCNYVQMHANSMHSHIKSQHTTDENAEAIAFNIVNCKEILDVPNVSPYAMMRKCNISAKKTYVETDSSIDMNVPLIKLIPRKKRGKRKSEKSETKKNASSLIAKKVGRPKGSKNEVRNATESPFVQRSKKNLRSDGNSSSTVSLNNNSVPQTEDVIEECYLEELNNFLNLNLADSNDEELIEDQVLEYENSTPLPLVAETSDESIAETIEQIGEYIARIVDTAELEQNTFIHANENGNTTPTMTTCENEEIMNHARSTTPILDIGAILPLCDIELQSPEVIEIKTENVIVVDSSSEEEISQLSQENVLLRIQRIAYFKQQSSGDNVIHYLCLFDSCNFKSVKTDDFIDHLSDVHYNEIWNGYCNTCVADIKDTQINSVADEFEHLMSAHLYKLGTSTASEDLQITPREESSNPITDCKEVELHKPSAVDHKPILLPSCLSLMRYDPSLAIAPSIINNENQSHSQSMPSVNPSATIGVPKIVSIAENSNIHSRPTSIKSARRQSILLSALSNDRSQQSHITPSKPWTENSGVKNRKFHDEMLKVPNLDKFFKCMAFACSFCSHNRIDFLEHIKSHERFAEDQLVEDATPLDSTSWLECSYCETIADSCDNLMDHLKEYHLKCVYQCGYCFYRSMLVNHIVSHISVYHKDKALSVIVSNKTAHQVDINFERLLDFQKMYVQPLKCTDCDASIYSIHNYSQHIAQHSTVNFVCHVCKETTSVQSVTQHLATHEIGYYECIYCPLSFTSLLNVQCHLCNYHATESLYICVRLAHNKGDPTIADDNINSVFLVNIGQSVKVDAIFVRESDGEVIIQSIDLHENLKPKSYPSNFNDACVWTFNEYTEFWKNYDAQMRGVDTSGNNVRRSMPNRRFSVGLRSATSSVTATPLKKSIPQIAPAPKSVEVIPPCSALLPTTLAPKSVEVIPPRPALLPTAPASKLVEVIPLRSAIPPTAPAPKSVEDNPPRFAIPPLPRSAISSTAPVVIPPRSTIVKSSEYVENRDDLQVVIDSAALKLSNVEFSDVNNLVCYFDICKTKPKNYVDLNSHLLWHKNSSTNNDRCFFCDKKFVNDIELEIPKHIKTHLNNRYFCYYCQYKSSLYALIYLHVTTEHHCASVKYMPINPKFHDFNTDIFVMGCREMTKDDIFNYGCKLVLHNRSMQNITLPTADEASQNKIHELEPKPNSTDENVKESNDNETSQEQVQPSVISTQKIEPTKKIIKKSTSKARDHANKNYIMYSCISCAYRCYDLMVMKDHWREKHQYNKEGVSRTVMGRPFGFKITKHVKCFHCGEIRCFHEMLTHFKTKHKDSPFITVEATAKRKCGECDIKCQARKEMILHYKTCHQKGNIPRYLPDDLIRKEIIERYVSMASNNMYICNICSVESDILDELQSHHQQAHSNSEMNIQKKSSEISYSCCHIWPLTKSDLILHIRNHHWGRLCNRNKINNVADSIRLIFPNGFSCLRSELVHTDYGNINDILDMVKHEQPSQVKSNKLVAGSIKRRRESTNIDIEQLRVDDGVSPEKQQKFEALSVERIVASSTNPTTQVDSQTPGPRSYYGRLCEEIDDLTKIYTTISVGDSDVIITCAQFANLFNIHPKIYVERVFADEILKYVLN